MSLHLYVNKHKPIHMKNVAEVISNLSSIADRKKKKALQQHLNVDANKTMLWKVPLVQGGFQH